jgi:sugar (pentulose or hexulose) kinase
MRVSPEDAEGLECAPYFRGTRREPHRRGEFRGVSVGNFTPANVGRSVLNGIAAGMEMFYRLAGTAGPWPAERIIATGNAVRRNPLLIQRLANVLQLPVDVPVHREEAAYGAALLAGAHTGLWRTLSEAGCCIRHQRLAVPQPLGDASPA